MSTPKTNVIPFPGKARQPAIEQRSIGTQRPVDPRVRFMRTLNEDPRLVAIIRRWPELPENIKGAFYTAVMP